MLCKIFINQFLYLWESFLYFLNNFLKCTYNSVALNPRYENSLDLKETPSYSTIDMLLNFPTKAIFLVVVCSPSWLKIIKPKFWKIIFFIKFKFGLLYIHIPWKFKRNWQRYISGTNLVLFIPLITAKVPYAKQVGSG